MQNELSEAQLKVRQEALSILMKEFDDNSLDFCYIDAKHHYESVKQDTSIWYPKIKEQWWVVVVKMMSTHYNYYQTL